MVFRLHGVYAGDTLTQGFQHLPKPLWMFLAEILHDAGRIVAGWRKVFRVAGRVGQPNVGFPQVRQMPALDQRAQLRDERICLELPKGADSKRAGVVELVGRKLLRVGFVFLAARPANGGALATPEVHEGHGTLGLRTKLLGFHHDPPVQFGHAQRVHDQSPVLRGVAKDDLD